MDGSSVLRTDSFFFHHLVDGELEFTLSANCSNLVTASWNFVVAWEFCLCVEEHVFDAILKFSSNEGAWRWQRCLLHLLSSASRSTFLTTVHVLLPSGYIL